MAVIYKQRPITEVQTRRCAACYSLNKLQVGRQGTKAANRQSGKAPILPCSFPPSPLPHPLFSLFDEQETTITDTHEQNKNDDGEDGEDNGSDPDAARTRL